jgi:hypothetical protein
VALEGAIEQRKRCAIALLGQGHGAGTVALTVISAAVELVIGVDA